MFKKLFVVSLESHQLLPLLLQEVLVGPAVGREVVERQRHSPDDGHLDFVFVLLQKKRVKKR